MKETLRERTFSWSDPRAVVRAIAGRPHIEWLREMQRGTFAGPPAAYAMNMSIEQVEPGHIVFGALAEEWMANPLAVVHGGFISTLLDTVLTLCVLSQLPPDRVCTTTDLHVHFVRPLVPDGQKFIADGRALHVGTTLGTSEGRVFDARGKLVAHGTSSLAILDVTRSPVQP